MPNDVKTDETQDESVAEIVAHYEQKIADINKAHEEEITRLRKHETDTIKAILMGRNENPTITTNDNTDNDDDIDDDDKIANNIIEKYKKKRGF